jgi:hypothetical protein
MNNGTMIGKPHLTIESRVKVSVASHLIEFVGEMDLKQKCQEWSHGNRFTD